MTRAFHRAAPLALTLVVAGCGGSSGGGTSGAAVTAPSPVSVPAAVPTPAPSPTPPPAAPACSTTVLNLPSSVSALAGRYAFSIVTASGCRWTAVTDATWGDVAPGSGDGNATPTLNFSENPNRDARTLTVTIAGQSFRITQNAPGCNFRLDRSTLDVGVGGGPASLFLTADPGCTWTAAASESWIRVLTPSGTGSGRIDLEIAANTSDVRHAYVIVAGLRVDVSQQPKP